MKFRAIARPVVDRIPPTDKWLSGAWARLYQKANVLLAQRLKENDLADIEYAPGGDTVVIYRLPERTADVRTASGIVIATPEENQTFGRAVKDGQWQPLPMSADSPYNVGLLLATGPEAADILEGKGFFPGDYVVFSKFAGDEETVGRVNEAIKMAASQGATKEEALEAAKALRTRLSEKKMLLRMRAHDLQASHDLATRLYGESPELELVRQVTETGVLHIYRPAKG
jgi:co-chaperonin GroES (HSP10)